MTSPVAAMTKPVSTFMRIGAAAAAAEYHRRALWRDQPGDADTPPPAAWALMHRAEGAACGRARAAARAARVRVTKVATDAAASAAAPAHTDVRHAVRGIIFCPVRVQKKKVEQKNSLKQKVDSRTLPRLPRPPARVELSV